MRAFAIVFVISALGFTRFANAEDVWVKTANQDCEVFANAPLGSDETVNWSGSCENGRASGVGQLEWSVNDRIAGYYEGGMAGGKLHGKGVLRLEIKNGKGFDRLEATFVEGKPEGEARYDLPNGDFYIGNLKDGKPDGVGYHRKSDGIEYYGDFEDGDYHGIGVVTDSEGNSYIGQFVKGAGKGFGVYEAADGSTYSGAFSDSLPNGAGTYTSPNGDIYQGVFKSAKADGTFLVTRTDGHQSVEKWKDGEKVQ
jgi:hypothetical protein